MKTKLFELDNKVKTWIENNRIKWCFILFSLGLGLGLCANLLFGGNNTQGLKMGFIYAFLLVFIEIKAGGSGID